MFSLHDGFTQADDVMKSRIAADIRAHIGGDLQKIHAMDVNHADTTYKHILMPVWLGAFRYGGKSHNLCVNGQTGEVQGQRPYSWIKVAAAILAAAAIGALIIYLGANPYP